MPLSHFFIRSFAWSNIAIMLVFITNKFTTFVIGLPAATLMAGLGGLVQWFMFPACILLAIFWVLCTPKQSVLHDSFVLSNANAFFIRVAFFAVLLIGLVDTAISFLRIEGLLSLLVSESMDKNIGRSWFRGLYIHMPLVFLAIIIACWVRTLGFHWLSLLIIIAELLIVIFRFIFSYEQAFMADLVRFWYGALFLFASSYTLLHDGHVRVDVFYAGFSHKIKSRINAIGSILLGVGFCWTILYLGLAHKASIISGPILNFETSQSGFGLYVKYLMASFLAIFAISMMVQFMSYFMIEAVKYRGEKSEHLNAD